MGPIKRAFVMRIKTESCDNYLRGPYYMVYDQECGLCRSFKGLIKLLDTRRRLRFLSLMSPASAVLLGNMPVKQRIASFHLITPQGVIASRDEAFPLLADLLIGTRLAGRLLERSRRIKIFLALVYYLVTVYKKRTGC